MKHIERKIFALVLALIIAFALTACGKPLTHDNGSSSVVFENDSVALSFPMQGDTTAPIVLNTQNATAKGLSFRFKNQLDREYIYDSAYVLLYMRNEIEYMRDGIQYELATPIIENWTFPYEVNRLLPNTTTEWISVDWQWLYGELPSGGYLIQKELLFFRESGAYDTFVVDGYFSIS